MAVDLPALFGRTRALPAPAVAATPQRARWMLPPSLGPLALVALIIFLRTPYAWLDPQFCQEDGAVFFDQNYLHGWRAIFIPYAGYLHVCVRLSAWVAGFFPLIFQPALYNAGAAALCLAVVARLMRPGIRLPHKTLLAIAVVLVPRGGGGEILGTLTNVQWFLALVPVLMLIEETTPTGWRAGLDLGQLVLVGLSGPFVLMCVPLFAAKFVWLSRSRWNAICLGTAIFCGAAQAWFIHGQHDSSPVTPTLDEWLRYLAWKPIGPLFFGKGFTVQFLAPWMALAMLLGLGILLVALNRRQPAWRWPTAVFAIFGLFVVIGSASRFVRNPAAFLPVNDVDRYFFLPRLLLVWCLLPHLRTHGGWRRWLLWVPLAMAGVAAAVDFPCPGPPDSWWPQQVAAFERGETDTLKTFPNWRIFLDRPSSRSDHYADVLGEPPRRILPLDEGARILIGAESFLQLRSASSSLVYEVPAQPRTIAGRYACAPGAEGMIEFSILYFPANADGSQTLWHVRLDPAHVPADRGAHAFETALPVGAIGRLILHCQPAPGEASTGGCWAGIRFR